MKKFKGAIDGAKSMKGLELYALKLEDAMKQLQDVTMHLIEVAQE